MLTATPASNGAPADSAAKADRGAAERCACCARAAWYAVGRAARGEGRCRSRPVAGTQPDKQETFAPYVAAVKQGSRSLRVFSSVFGVSGRNAAVFHRIACCAPTSVKARRRRRSAPAVFFGLENAEGRFAGRTCRAVWPRPHPGHTATAL